MEKPELEMAFQNFGKWAFKKIADSFSEGAQEIEIEDLMEIAGLVGLARTERYDPAVHANVNEAEPGDSIWYWGFLPIENREWEFISHLTREPLLDLSQTGVLIRKDAV